ncbi:MAG: hypothetical protein Q7R35_01150 [Elusimicrobiota bacterium]|nr:hypothetical protein [Elusimicrobiota bacterium]
MKKIMKWVLIVFAVSGAAFVAFNLLLGVKQKDCLEGEGPRAIEACTFLIANHTAGYRADYLVRRAQLLEKRNEWDKVISDLELVIAMKTTAHLPPERVLAAYESLARMHLKKGNAAEIKKYFELAAQNGSKDPEIYISLAGTYVEEKKFQEALGLLVTAGGFEKAKTHSYYNALASAYEGLNDYEKAYAALRTGIALPAPGLILAGTSKHLGLVCYELKRYKEAETYLDYTLKSGMDCLECGLLLTTIRGALAPRAPAGRARKPRK